MTKHETILDDGPYATPRTLPPADDVRWRISTQTLLVLSLYAVLAFSNASNVFYYENAAAYYACSLAFAILATVWAVNDSRLRNLTFHPVLRMVHLLLCPVSPVIYLVCTRGLRGLGVAALHAVLMLIVAYAAFFGVYYAIYYSGYWELYDPVYFSS